MPQSLVQIYVHLVFSTKHRTPWLDDAEQRKRVHAYMAGICQQLDCPALIIDGVADHVHLLLRLSKSMLIPDLVRDLKRDSTKWIKETFTQRGDFHWQEGYGAFSVSPRDVDDVTRYIAGQEEHHRKEPFQEELRRILLRCGVTWDEKYVWD